MTKPKRTRVAIVSDQRGQWFVRRIRLVEHDLDKDEKVYRCDEHIGGPYDLDQATAEARAHVHGEITETTAGPSKK